MTILKVLCIITWLFAFQAVQGALLSSMYAVLDYAQTGLIAAVFFFKVSAIHRDYVKSCISNFI